MTATEPARFHVREATREDVPALVKLVHELAVYEKEPDAVAPNAAELYERNMFEHEYAKALLACDGPEGSGGEAIGMALCVPTTPCLLTAQVLFQRALLRLPDAASAVPPPPCGRAAQSTAGIMLTTLSTRRGRASPGCTSRTSW